jgi:hypothetical protein
MFHAYDVPRLLALQAVDMRSDRRTVPGVDSFFRGCATTLALIRRLAMPSDIEQQLKGLDDFDPAKRLRVLASLKKVGIPATTPLSPPHVNLHCHTFFSYNGYGASPSRIAWEAFRSGWYAAAICDFDVLDGLEEFLAATDLLGVRAAVHMETRVFFHEYADDVINSPGEPGVYYFMGAGFCRAPEAGSWAADQLSSMRQAAQTRNLDIIERVNAFLGAAGLDYTADVLPRTPAGNATERHIVAAYQDAAERQFGDGAELHAFWADRLGSDAETVAAAATDRMGFADLLRSKLMKAGGPGYVKPGPESFPPLDDVIRLGLECQAIPCATWLDGMSTGEHNIASQLECLIGKGVAALNIIPDRNWNVKDATERARKISKFHECVAVADKLHLPINVGTELNKFGQRWVDDFTAEPMRAVGRSLLTGARIVIGHQRLVRFADCGYLSSRAAGEFGDDTAAKHAFFAAVGGLPCPDQAHFEQLRTATPDANHTWFHDQVRALAN